MPIPKKILIRVIGAPALLAVLGGLLYLGYRSEQKGTHNIPLIALLQFVALAAYWEFRAFCRAKAIAVDAAGPCLALVLLFGSHATGLLTGGYLQNWGLISLVFGLYVLAMIVFRYGKFTPEAAGMSLLGYGYISLLVMLLAPPVPRAVATFYLLFLLAASKGSDMAAFVVGKSMGKHKMTPVVSPNKTWEGGIGGAIVGTGAGLAVLLLTPVREAYAGVPIAALLFFSLLVTIAAQVGDLVKSAFKRWAGVKDSGRLLPEFGGMLDMVDSFLIAGPVAHLGTILLLRIFRGT